MNISRKILICQLIAIIYVAIFFGKNIYAHFSLIDDHEILNNIIKLKDSSTIWSLMADSEMGSWGTSTRYRPAYHFFYILESYLLGDRAELWYLERLFILQQFIGLLTFILWQNLGLLLAGSAALWIFSQPYWSDIFSRLGPGEVYGVLGFSIILVAWILSEKRKTTLATALFIIGGCIAAGSKENLAVMTIILSVFLLITKARSTFQKISMISLILYSLFILIGVYVATRSSGIDVVGESTDLSTRLSLLLKIFKPSVLVITFLCFTFITYLQKNRIKKLKPTTEWWTLLSCYAVLVLNFLFYAGKWPTGTRYDFPGLLFFTIAIAITLKFWTNYYNLAPKKTNLLSIIILFAVGLTSIKGLSKIRFNTLTNVERTHKTTKLLEEVENYVHDVSSPLLVIEVENPSHSYEYLYSLRRFLMSREIKADIRPRLHRPKKSFAFKSLERELLSALENERPVPMSEVNCLSIIVRDDPPKKCNYSFYILNL